MNIQFNSNKLKNFLFNHSYEILLVSLLFHLYGSVLFFDIHYYGIYGRTFNTIFLYLATLNNIYQRNLFISKTISLILTTTLLINLSLIYFESNINLQFIRDVSFFIFLLILFYNTAKFLFSPNRFDKALISSSVCGYLLIIEVAVRTFLLFNKFNTNLVLSNIDYSYHTNTFIDLVYFCTVTITSIGYEDIVPTNHNSKMVASLLGLIGQFYLIIIMGIMVGKFVSSDSNK